MYDAIIVGSRCAGAATALQLARRGRRVLVVDRATFPSDVLSGHTIQPAGVARLARWGLLDRLRATGVPFARTVRFDAGDVVLEGVPVPADGIDAAVCIRRTVVDPLLADAAAAAGAEIRLGVSVTALLWADGRVVGVVCRDRHGATWEARASVVIGADGARSGVARAVGAGRYHERPATTVTAYSYWRDAAVDGLELYVRPGCFLVAAPTNDGLTFIAQQVPAASGDRYRHRTGQAFEETLEAAPRLAELVAGGQRAERFRIARTDSNFLRQPAGSGWALVGDAGCHKDPITAQGMLDALRDAELLATAVDEGLEGDLSAAMRGYQRARDEAVVPMYELTCALADLEAPPPQAMQQLLADLQGQPGHIARFLGVMAGSVAVPDFYGPESVAAITAGARVASAA